MSVNHKYEALTGFDNHDITNSIIEESRLGEYENERLIHKNGLLSGTIMLSKTSLGSTLLIIQYYFIKLGLIPSVLITILVVIFVNIFLILFAKISDRVEKDKKIEIETLNGLTKEILGDAMGVFSKIVMIIYNTTFILMNSMLLARYFSHLAKKHVSIEILAEEWFYKLIFVFLIVILSLSVVAPEKIRFTVFTASALFYASMIVLYSFVIKEIPNNKSEVDLLYFDSNYIWNFTPLMITAFESIAALFTIRSTLKKRSQMSLIFIIKAFIVIPVYILNSCFFLFVR